MYLRIVNSEKTVFIYTIAIEHTCTVVQLLGLLTKVVNKTVKLERTLSEI